MIFPSFYRWNVPDIFFFRHPTLPFPCNGFLTRLSWRHVSLSVALTCRTWVSRVFHSTPGIFSQSSWTLTRKKKGKNPRVKAIPPRQVSFMSNKIKGKREGPLAVVIVDVTGLVGEERQKERSVRVRSARANERCLVPRRPYRVELCQGKNGESACTLLIRLCPAEKRKKGSSFTTLNG